MFLLSWDGEHLLILANSSNVCCFYRCASKGIFSCLFLSAFKIESTGNILYASPINLSFR